MPIIGAQGPGSQIAWRGNLDEYPDEFIFPEITEVFPGAAATSISVPITGINYKALFTAVGSGCSVRVTPYDDNTQTYGAAGPFLPGNDPNNPIILRNNDKVELQVVTEAATQRSDYNRPYPVTVTAGVRPSIVWSVTTRFLDDDPDEFSFVNLDNLEINTLTNSDVVTITGIDDVVGVDVFIVSPTGELSINGGPFVSSGKIFDGDTLQLRNTTTNDYSTPLVTTVQLGIFSTDFVITTRPADTTIDDNFNFTNISDVDINTTHESNSITITGADENLNGNNPLPISITGGKYKIERDGQLITDFTDVAGTTQNGDVITLQVVASSEYSTPTTVSVTISQLTKEYTATTRPRPIDTIPDQFTFTDRIDVDRNRTITSNTITLSGMTDFGDEGTASISSAAAVNAKFKVERGGVTVRDYSSSSYSVRNGDKITIQLTSSPNSLGTVSTTFTIAGTNTFDIISGINGSTTDTWNVTSAERFCNITTFSLPNKTGNSGGLQPGELASTTFVATGFDYDCGMTVTTSNANSYLKIGSRQGTSLSNVQIDDEVEVYMSTPYYDQTRTTTVTLTSSYGTSRSANWTIGPVSPPSPTIDLDAQNRSVPFVFPDGGTAVLTYDYNFVTQSSVVTNFGLNSISPNTLSSGVKSGTRVVPNLQSGSNTFNMRVSNSSGNSTDSVTVIVGTPPNPTVSLCPSDTSSCSSTSSRDKNGSITLYWKTTNAVRTESPDFNTGGKQNGSITISNLTQDNKTFTVRAIGAGDNPVVVTATHTVNLNPFVSLTANRTSITTGDSVTLSWSSDYAVRVVNTSGSGFSASSLSGSTTVTPPRGNTTYGITVEDNQGLQSSSTVTIRASDDTTVDSFSMDPSSILNVNRSSNHESQPVFTNGGSQVSGLSPGTSVTATVTGGVFTSGGTSKTVSNGTSTSSLRIRVTASSNYAATNTATLNIGGVSRNFSVSTESCVVENSTDSHDGLSFNTRRCVASSGFNSMCFLNIRGGSGDIGRSGNGQTGAIEFGRGTHTWTVPSGVNSVTCSVIGAGGSGAGNWFAVRTSGRFNNTRYEVGGGGGGGGARRENVSCSAGQVFTITVGEGGGEVGQRDAGDGGRTRISGAGRNIDGGGGEGGRSGGGVGGSPNGGSASGPTPGGAGRIVGGTCTYYSGSNVINGSCADESGYGAGGQGTNELRGLSATKGQDGRARLNWTINFTNYSKQDVVKKIADAYWSKGRPPTVQEIRNWYNSFRDNPASNPTLDNLYNSIRGSIGSWTGANDNCGNGFPRSY